MVQRYRMKVCELYVCLLMKNNICGGLGVGFVWRSLASG